MGAAPGVAAIAPEPLEWTRLPRKPRRLHPLRGVQQGRAARHAMIDGQGFEFRVQWMSSVSRTPDINAWIGWTLAIAGFAAAIWIDPWSLSQRDSAMQSGDLQTVIRQSQLVVIRMALLQLALSQLIAQAWFDHRAMRITSWLTATGALIYAAGHALLITWLPFGWLIPIGAVINLLGFATLCSDGVKQRKNWQLTAILGAVCFGMVLDMAMGLFIVDPDLFRPAYLGADDQVRMRMLRLAQVAVIALPVLALLYYQASLTSQRRAVRLGQWAMTLGAIGMPILLTVAGFTTLLLKYLLSLPSWAVVGGTIMGIWLASHQGRRLELWGWTLIGASLGLGLLMSMYAFDGPFSAPGFIGEYNDFARALLRLGHAYAIVLGILIIFVARELVDTQDRTPVGRTGAYLLVSGSVVTVAAISLVGVGGLPVAALGVGPGLVAVGTAICVGVHSLREMS